MTRYTKDAHGHYHIHGKKYEMLMGSRAQVWHGTAYKTSGELKKDNLVQNKSGRIVSKSKHATAKREKRLVRAGYGTKKGKFGFVLLNGKTRKHRGSKKHRGGAAVAPAVPVPAAAVPAVAPAVPVPATTAANSLAAMLQKIAPAAPAAKGGRRRRHSSRRR